MRMRDITGQKFGRLTALWRVSAGGRSKWHCKCDCGAETEVLLCNLTQGRQLSCGCLRQESRTRHGKYGTRIYFIWNAMIQRCENPNDPAFAYYGGRGITVAEEWHDFRRFYADVGDPASGMTLDRIENNSGYRPGNVRWVSRKRQARNTRVTFTVTHGGKTQSLDDWAEQLGVSREKIRGRLRRGWSIERALAQT